MRTLLELDTIQLSLPFFIKNINNYWLNLEILKTTLSNETKQPRIFANTENQTNKILLIKTV